MFLFIYFFRDKELLCLPKPASYSWTQVFALSQPPEQLGLQVHATVPESIKFLF